MSSVESRTIGLFQGPCEQKFKNLLTAAGWTVRLLEVRRISIVDVSDKIAAVIGRNHHADWLVFCSSAAVDCFASSLKKAGFTVTDLDAQLVCAVGEETADRLRGHLIHCDVASRDASLDAAIREISAFSGDQRQLTAFLIRGEDDSKSPATAPNTIQLMDLQVCKAELISGDQLARTRALIAGGAIDALIVTASDLPILHKLAEGRDGAAIFSEIEIYADPAIIDELRQYDAYPLTAIIPAGS